MSALPATPAPDAPRPAEVRNLKLTDIRIDGDTQSRAALNEDVVADYASSVRDGTDFPAVIVFFDGSHYWLADGFHRFHGYRKAGADEIAAEVRIGSKRDAILYSVGANAQHGLRRTNDDKRKAALTLLNDTEWSNGPIARSLAALGSATTSSRHCVRHCHRMTVSGPTRRSTAPRRL